MSLRTFSLTFALGLLLSLFASAEPAVREIVCDKQYLHLPVKTGAPKTRVALSVEGAKVREFEIELAPAEPDWWAFLDLTPFRGKMAIVSADKLAEGSAALTRLELGDTLKGAEHLYREPLRPQFHFSSRRGWLNDPNGLVFQAGEYHLFYQHNPYGWPWGNMHWGHAVSADLVHWRELPIAIYPKQFGDWPFSGSAVLDPQNTSGWKRGEDDVMVVAYTSTGRGECILYSHDRGRTFNEFEGNPVVRHEGRDPKLLWHAPTKQWVMVLYNEDKSQTDKAKLQGITFHTSPDLKKWTYQSRIAGFYECPDLFELPVDGDVERSLWVLTAASSEYLLGSFDGREFKPGTPKLRGHRGEGFYAGQTYSDEPQGRRVQIGWGRVDAPGMPFNQLMFFPCELSLRTTSEGVRLCWQPVKELANLRAKTHPLAAGPLKPGDNPLANISSELLEIRAEFAPGSAHEMGFDVRGTRVLYRPGKQELLVKNHRIPLAPIDGKVRLVLLIDRTTLEVFANEGAAYVPLGIPASDRPVRMVAEGGEAKITSLEVHELRSIWPQ